MTSRAMNRPRTRLGPADHGRALSPDEFQDADGEPGYLYELARGVVEVVEVPGDAHAQIVDNLHEALSADRRRHPGRILRIGHGSDVRLTIPEVGSDRHPDLAVTFADAPRDPRGRRLPGLVIEVVSPGAEARERDFVAKRADYLAAGVGEYWIVDPESRTVHVLIHTEGPGVGPEWGERVCRGDDVIPSALLTGFAGIAAELWPD